jgi:hypothetical protein
MFLYSRRGKSSTLSKKKSTFISFYKEYVKLKTVSPILENFRNRPSVQIGWFKNSRNLLQGTKIVDRYQIFVGPELILCELGTKY